MIDDNIQQTLNAPWRRETSGYIEYVLDNSGRTVCTRIIGGEGHDAIMGMIARAPTLLQACEVMLKIIDCSGGIYNYKGDGHDDPCLVGWSDLPTGALRDAVAEARGFDKDFENKEAQ